MINEPWNSIYTRLMVGFVVDIEPVHGGDFHRTDDLGLTKGLNCFSEPVI